MSEFRIETDGLTMREVFELEELIRSFEDVEDTKFSPFLPGVKQNRMMPSPQMALTTIHVLFRLAVKGVVMAAGKHFYKVGEGLWTRFGMQLS